MVVGKRRSVTECGRGKGVVRERHNVRQCKGSFVRVVMLDSARGNGSIGRVVMLKTVQLGKGSFGRAVMLQTVQGVKGSVWRHVLLQTLQGERVVREIRDVFHIAGGKQICLGET